MVGTTAAKAQMVIDCLRDRTPLITIVGAKSSLAKPTQHFCTPWYLPPQQLLASLCLRTATKSWCPVIASQTRVPPHSLTLSFTHVILMFTPTTKLELLTLSLSVSHSLTLTLSPTLSPVPPGAPAWAPAAGGAAPAAAAPVVTVTATAPVTAAAAVPLMVPVTPG
jgi:hypothetical protein